MATKDSRSYKVLFIPDYALNPESYPDLPQRKEIYEGARDAGYGVVKLPPPDAPQGVTEAWIEMAVDMVEEYLKRGYVAAVVSVDGLPGGGVWTDKLFKELEKRGAPKPKIVEVSKEELEAGGKQLKLKIKSIF